MTDKTLHATIEEYIDFLKNQGKSERTIYTYQKGAPESAA